MNGKMILGTAGALASLLVFAGLSHAIDVEVKIGDKKVQVSGEKKDKPIKTTDKVEVDTIYRASSILEIPVRNREKEKLGQIEDMVIDLKTGEIRYVALSFGGVLGLGDKMFAIPYSSMKLHHDENETYFVLNVAKERLQNAKGFDQEHWPNTADPKWNLDTHKYYADGAAAKPTTPEEGTPDYSGVMRISKVTGMDVRNDKDEALGDIEELVFNLDTGKVRYAALSFGGLLGIGDKLFAVPWDAFTLQQTDDEKYFVLAVSKERLKTAPGFNKDEWPDTANPNWREEIDVFYQAKKAADQRRP